MPFAPGDIVAYHNPRTLDPIQQTNERQLRNRVGLVRRVASDGRTYPVKVQWTGWCQIDHEPSHLALIR